MRRAPFRSVVLCRITCASALRGESLRTDPTPCAWFEMQPACADLSARTWAHVGLSLLPISINLIARIVDYGVHTSQNRLCPSTVYIHLVVAVLAPSEHDYVGRLMLEGIRVESLFPYIHHCHRSVRCSGLRLNVITVDGPMPTHKLFGSVLPLCGLVHVGTH